jgi:SHAQKYF class myb-like DNA-binding protein
VREELDEAKGSRGVEIDGGYAGPAIERQQGSQRPPPQMMHGRGGGGSGTDSEGSGSGSGSGSMRSSSTVPAKSALSEGKQQQGSEYSDTSRDRQQAREAGSVVGKRCEPETSSSADSGMDMKEHIKRLCRDNKQLKSALSKSQEEVKKLKSVIEMHEMQSKKSAKEDAKGQTRYWTDAEHQRFLDALQTIGPKDVKAIAQYVGSRSATQVRTHAQKYFIKLARMKKSAEEAAKAGVPACTHGAWWLQVRTSSWAALVVLPHHGLPAPHSILRTIRRHPCILRLTRSVCLRARVGWRGAWGPLTFFLCWQGLNPSAAPTSANAVGGCSRHQSLVDMDEGA